MQLTSVLTCTFTSSAPSPAQRLFPWTQLPALREMPQEAVGRNQHDSEALPQEELRWRGAHLPYQTSIILKTGLGEEVRAAEVGAFSPPGSRTQTFQTLKEALLFVVWGWGGGGCFHLFFLFFSKLLKAPKQTALVTDWVMEWPTDWCHSQRWRCS